MGRVPRVAALALAAFLGLVTGEDPLFVAGGFTRLVGSTSGEAGHLVEAQNPQSGPMSHRTFPDVAGSLHAVASLTNEGTQLLVGGQATEDGSFRGLLHWDGSSWQSSYHGLQMLNYTTNQVNAILVHLGRVFIGGRFYADVTSTTTALSHFAYYDPYTGIWAGLAPEAGPDDAQLPIRSIESYSDTQVSIGGGASEESGAGYFNVVTIAGTNPSSPTPAPLSGLCKCSAFNVRAITTKCGGKIYVGGSFGVKALDPLATGCGDQCVANWKSVPDTESGDRVCSVKLGQVTGLQCQHGLVFAAGDFQLPVYKLGVYSPGGSNESASGGVGAGRGWGGPQCCAEQTGAASGCPSVCTYDLTKCGPAVDNPDATSVSVSLDASVAYIGFKATEEEVTSMLPQASTTGWSELAATELSAKVVKITVPSDVWSLSNAELMAASETFKSNATGDGWRFVGGDVLSLSRYQEVRSSAVSCGSDWVRMMGAIAIATVVVAFA